MRTIGLGGIMKRLSDWYLVVTMHEDAAATAVIIG